MNHPTGKRLISVVLCGSLFLGTTFQSLGLAAMAQTAANANDQALDKLMGPIALYPDPLLAQVLACTTSPQQVTEVSTWLKQQDKELQGSALQEAASAKGFDASFTAIVLFPEVLETMAKNMPWTTEVGKAFLSDQQSVLDSVQRLRKQAQMMGNLKKTPQQEVKTDSQNGQQVIVIQPANPQVVYVPVYNTQVVYTTPPPPPEKNNDAAAAAVLGFMVGIAIGAAMSDPYPYGWSAWGVGWHSHSVVVVGGAWRVPPGARYPYTRPVPHGTYRAPANINAPSYNVNNVNVNINTSKNVSTTPRPTTQPANQPAARPTTTPAATPNTAKSPSTSQTAASRSSTLGSSGATPATGASATQSRTGTSSSAFSGYQNRSSTTAASSRGQRSVSGGGAKRR